MSKLSARPPIELTEIERFIQDLMIDTQHPVNDWRHPQHRDCIIALRELMERADLLRKTWLIS